MKVLSDCSGNLMVLPHQLLQVYCHLQCCSAWYQCSLNMYPINTCAMHFIFSFSSLHFQQRKQLVSATQHSCCYSVAPCYIGNLNVQMSRYHFRGRADQIPVKQLIKFVLTVKLAYISSLQRWFMMSKPPLHYMQLLDYDYRWCSVVCELSLFLVY